MKTIHTMKKLILIAALGLMMTACGDRQQTLPSSSDGTKLNVMSFNIRYDNPEDSLNNWKYRKDRAANAVRFYDADILGTQEVLSNQLADLKERLPEYTAIGVGREDGKEEGEFSALFFKKDRFEELESGTFWLSETPEVAGSLGWDGACRRVATWARLKDNLSGKTILALNTHLDHVGQVARREGINLIFRKVKELGQGADVIVTGDFNSTPDSDVVKHITNPDDPDHLNDSKALAGIVYGPSWSWHDFGELPYDRRPLIDYVFVSGDIDVDRYGVLAETENGEFLSDHAPVLVTLNLK